MKKIVLFATFILSSLFADGLTGVTYFEFSDDNFNLTRTYFTYKNTISEQLSYKFQTDVGQVGDDRLSAYLKKAQLDWKLSNNMKISMGLIGLNMFNIQEKTWGNRFVAKSAMDANKWSHSADLGVSLANDFGSVTANLMMTNGEGYKNTSELDNNSKISLQLLYGEKRLDKNNGYNVGLVHSSIKSDGMAGNLGEDVTTAVWTECDGVDDPVEGCTEDGGYWDSVTTTVGASDEVPETDTSVMGLFGGWSNTNIVVGAEYNTMDVSFANSDEDVSSKLTSIYANYIIRNNLSAFARIDSSDPSTKTDKDETNTTIVGFIWSPINGLTISPNIQIVDSYILNDNDKIVSNSEDTFSVNFQFKF